MVHIMEKRCYKCSEIKNVSGFSKNKSSKDGICSTCKMCAKAYYLENRDKILLTLQEKYEKNRIKKIEYQRKYRKENKEKVADEKRKYLSKRRSEDPVFAMKYRLARRMLHALKSKGMTKNMNTLQALGCSAEQFRRHIELQFEKGMNWGNRKNWELDHILSIGKAKTEIELYKLSHFTNIRPMWTSCNRKKSDNITHLI